MDKMDIMAIIYKELKSCYLSMNMISGAEKFYDTWTILKYPDLSQDQKSTEL
jgi:hypothetical protein